MPSAASMTVKIYTGSFTATGIVQVQYAVPHPLLNGHSTSFPCRPCRGFCALFSPNIINVVARLFISFGTLRTQVQRLSRRQVAVAAESDLTTT